MSVALFMFLAHGVAEQTSGYRPGARNALMLFATGQSVDQARSEAIARAISNGWAHIEVKREKALGADAGGIEDEVLRTAAETALAEGTAIVVYARDIPLDS